MHAYFRDLPAAKMVLWCYLVWYGAIVAQYFEANVGLWMSSRGIALLIGFALTLATAQRGRALDRWVIIRLYLFPFCVSSYSALIKGKGFVLLFPTELKPLLIAVAACVTFVLIPLSLRRFGKRRTANFDVA